MRKTSLLLFCSVLVLFLSLAGCGGTGGASGANPNATNNDNSQGGTAANGGGTNTGGTTSAGGTNPGATPADIHVVHHVIMMMQENRSFDSYFWKMTDYRQQYGIPINSSDGMIKDGSDPAALKWAANQPIKPYHTGSQCTEDLTPDWNESHIMMNPGDPAAAGPGSPMNGFVNVALGLSNYLGVLMDNTGHRAMGYFDDSDLNYYYFMASQFAMGDMFFSPVPTRTSGNRVYIHAATSQGHARPDDTHITTQLTAKTIWRELDDAGVTWKIYISDWGINNFTFFQFFTDYNTRASHVVPIAQYFADLQAGTLPNVAFIETGMHRGLDEHPTNNTGPGVAVPISQAIRVQAGAAWSAQIINALMASSSWKDSVFFWCFDEGGGAFDHVPPISVPNPDGIKPVDASPGDFTITGFRVPNMVISPFAKPHYVSHTPMDYTAYLRFIEARWNLPQLTLRDAAMPDMTEFFDFSNGGPWATPPTPPAQNMKDACDFSRE